MPNTSSEGIPAIVNAFVTELTGAVESVVSARVQELILAALGTAPKRGPGRPRKNGLMPGLQNGLALQTPVVMATRKRQKQLCPVPGCKNVAAPIFGMVCADHKDVSKTKIRQYREARRQSKAKGGRRALVVRGRAAARPRKAAKATKPGRTKVRSKPAARKTPVKAPIALAVSTPESSQPAA